GFKGQLGVWNLKSGEQVMELVGHTDDICEVAACTEDSTGLSCGRDGTVRLWSLSSGKQVAQFNGHEGIVWSVAYLPQQQKAVSAGEDGTIRLWSLALNPHFDAMRN